MTRGRVNLSGLDLIVRPERVEAALWRRLCDDGAIECRERLFTHYRGLARSIARRYGHSAGFDLSAMLDLEQAAYQGLLQAIDHYDSGRNIPFSAYARRRIGGSVRDAATQLTEAGARSDFCRRRDRERLKSVAAAHESATAHETALDQLADITIELALAFMLDQNGCHEGSLPGAVDNAFDSLAWRQLVGKLVHHVADLPEQEQVVIRQHYENDVLFAEIAAIMQLSKGRVSQLHKSALQRLAKKMRGVR